MGDCRVSPETKFVFSDIIVRKDKNNQDKHQKYENARMKNFYKQKDVTLINNCHLEEHHLCTKKLHLNNKGLSVFAKSILHLIESCVANTDIFDETHTQG